MEKDWVQEGERAGNLVIDRPRAVGLKRADLGPGLCLPWARLWEAEGSIRGSHREAALVEEKELFNSLSSWKLE